LCPAASISSESLTVCVMPWPKRSSVPWQIARSPHPHFHSQNRPNCIYVCVILWSGSPFKGMPSYIPYAFNQSFLFLGKKTKINYDLTIVL
jgi:hypothetical protein